jgi:hypothetical protein
VWSFVQDYALLRSLKAQAAEVEGMQATLLATRRNLALAEDQEDFDLCEVLAAQLSTAEDRLKACAATASTAPKPPQAPPPLPPSAPASSEPPSPAPSVPSASASSQAQRFRNTASKALVPFDPAAPFGGPPADSILQGAESGTVDLAGE